MKEAQSHKKGTSQNNKEHSVNKNVIVKMEKKNQYKTQKMQARNSKLKLKQKGNDLEHVREKPVRGIEVS